MPFGNSPLDFVAKTACLRMQALVSAYGEEQAQQILHDIYVNAGDHIESSGSAPLKLCEAGEVAIGFGLRHQAVAAKADGLPIDFVDPTEGNFSLTESVAVLDKGDKTNPEAMKMAQSSSRTAERSCRRTIRTRCMKARAQMLPTSLHTPRPSPSC